MQEQMEDFFGYIRGMIRRRRIILILASIISVIGWGIVFRIPNKYTSEARVQVDTRTMLRPLLKGIAVQSDMAGLVAVMKKLMFTQQNMLKVAELAGIKGDYASEKGRYAILEELKANVQIGVGKEEIFSISYAHTSPGMAQNVVQAVLSVFSEQTQQSTMGDVAVAQRFIEDQIREYEQRLRNAEKARETFKRANLGMLPGEGGDPIAKMQATRAEIEALAMKINELSSKKQVLKAQLEEALSTDEEWGVSDLAKKESEEDSRIQALRVKRDELLLTYTERHPSVVALDAMIKDIQTQKAQKDAEKNNTAAQPAEGLMLSPSSSPYAQAIKLDLNRIDVDIASLQSQSQMLQERLKQEDNEFNARLAVETQIQNLNRDYDTIKESYLKMVERREEADISEKMDNQITALKFKVVDPANRPVNPSSPNRKLLYSTIFGGAWAAGLFVALLLAVLNPVFTSAKSVRLIAGLPVLGYVSLVERDEEVKKRKRNSLLFLASAFLLVLGYSAMMATELVL